MEDGIVVSHAPTGSDAGGPGDWFIVLKGTEFNDIGAVRALLPLPDGTIMAGCDGGLLRCKDGVWSQKPDDSAVVSVEDLAVDESGELYAGGSAGCWHRAWITRRRRPICWRSVIPWMPTALCICHRSRAWAIRSTGRILKRIEWRGRK